MERGCRDGGIEGISSSPSSCCELTHLSSAFPSRPPAREGSRRRSQPGKRADATCPPPRQGGRPGDHCTIRPNPNGRGAGGGGGWGGGWEDGMSVCRSPSPSPLYPQRQKTVTLGGSEISIPLLLIEPNLETNTKHI